MSAPISPGEADPAIERSALDPAQKSLADALRITYRFIQLVVVVLFALFIMSGLETVGEGERGVKLTFGAIKESDLPPGQQFHLPYPVGELVSVHTGSNEIRIDRAFYPDRATPTPPRIRSKRSLKPGDDGSLITGDGAIVHAQWSAVYRVSESGVGSFVRNVDPTQARDLVRAAIMQGAVRVVAGLTVDEFLKRSSIEGAMGGEEAIEFRVREAAQRTLDAMDAGVLIERVTLDDRSPPGSVKDVFDEVSRQTSEASKEREQANRFAREQLNAVAGPASQDILDLIDRFEAHTDAGETEQAEEALAELDALFVGGVIETEGEPRIVSGEVTRIISDAQRYRTDVVTRAQAAADRFTAKLGLYRDNPAVYLASEWGGAFNAFIENTRAEVFAVPSAAQAEILINRDPDIAKQAESERNAAQAGETLNERRDAILNRDRSAEEDND